ncbi:OLC1v1035740C1 [Oldenlandia corymbosa var. corymbosa]|uniref:OLC1v1035740C1 n=1 Tax=Oldenlandia corymbosa var. corymbosa TaxID=529605 RepID=A0AAV1CTR8_OLDCO|nr:OLC1v1035740C1 [Oldenlandia corymbosa var. corymbosa]
MTLMSTSMVFCESFVFSNSNASRIPLNSHFLSSGLVHFSSPRRKFRGLVPKAKKKHPKRERSWWQRFFLDDDGNWLGLKEEDMLEDDAVESEDSSGEELSEDEKFEAWKRRAEAIIELREAQEDARNEENRRWEDWIVHDTEESVNGSSSWMGSSNGAVGKAVDEVREDPIGIIPRGGLVKSVKDAILGEKEDDILYEDRVFRYASFNSAKFLAVLIIVPCTLDFLVHDFILMPFLDRYVKTVPLAAQMLDVRTNQKLEIVEEIKLAKARYRLEVDIGKSPPLSDKELWMELHHKTVELRDERRLENRRAFANIWSDIVFGTSLFILLYFNQSKVALLKFAGYKIINNVSDTGKAFLIILITDIFLGYHSESGWQTLCEIIVEHYGLEVDEAAITIFICLFPVIIDACVKLWLFKFLPRLSPKVSNIFKEMKRH